MISRPHPSVLGRWRLLALLPLMAAALAGAMAQAGAASSRAEAGAGHGPEVGLRPADASDVAREGTDDPFAGRQLYVDPDSDARREAATARERGDERLAVLRTAVAILATGDMAVYLDGGHSDWHPAPEMAARLRSAGVHAARGFALNVVNFRRTDDELAYGRDVSERLGGGHFVVDTSRNGQGPHPGGAWCNPPGRGLGPTPRVSDTGDALADALLWIKRPGESDGECGRGEPEAGAWWPEHALGLASGRHDPGG